MKRPLPTCVLCGRACVPLADYDTTVCMRCDDTMAKVLACASAPQIRPTSPLLPCGTHAAFNRHRRRHEQPDPACIEAERLYQQNRHVRRQVGTAA